MTAKTPESPGIDFGQRFINRSLRFGRALRANGIMVTPGQVMTFIDATRHVGLDDPRLFREAAETTLVNKKEDIPVFHEVFDRFWRPKRRMDTGAEQLSDYTEISPEEAEAMMDGEEMPGDSEGDAMMSDTLEGMLSEDGEGGEPGDEDQEGSESILTYSAAEALREKDFSEFTEEELAIARRLMEQLEWDIGRRKSRRKVSSPKGRFIDYRKTMRRSLQTSGVPLRIFDRKVKDKPRALVVICDISGSMDRYSRLLLHFIHTIENDMAKVEAFVFGTRLTRITRMLKNRPIDEAIEKVSSEVQDWAGGTRIGESIQTFNQDWARRVLRNGAVVLVISDGWDRGDPDLLAAEMSRLQRSSYRLIWLNPLLGSPRYQPLTRGMQAALPFIDDFLPVHNLESLESLAEHLSSLADTRPVRRQVPLSFEQDRLRKAS
ncbi:MAG TPA: VWA domain-containing protein [Thermomicrobiales bacterium]|nr:VWA domain-containing protein [Thermomicrobiales bacterium]